MSDGHPSGFAIDPGLRDILERQFDRSYYSACHADVGAAGMDPFEHFMMQGWRENRNPNAIFNVSYYLTANPDVAQAGINPFQHYVLTGAGEGRRPRRDLDVVRRHLEASSSPRSRVPDWAAVADRGEPVSAGLLGRALAGSDKMAGLVVSVSHDDYAAHFGGVQNMISDEKTAFAQAGWDYLHLSPAAPLPLLAEAVPGSCFRVRVRLGDRSLGVAVFEDVVRCLEGVRTEGRALEVVYHHLMGWAPEVLTALAGLAQSPPVFWAHDFFALCPSYALMRNDVVYCGAPPPQSGACRICTFGEDRLEHRDRVGRFFEAVRPFILAPSHAALSLWLERGSLAHAGSAVIPLARLILSPDAQESGGGRRGGPLRVAHLGARLMHKGWTVFEDLALRLAGDDRYAFYHLGVDRGAALPGGIRNVPVQVTPDAREAMIEAIVERSIDVVVSWSLWPETFCFAVHEALAAGAYVVARCGSGHVWPAIAANAPAQGCAVETADELAGLFTGGAIIRRARECDARRGALVPGHGTADWLLRGRAAGSLGVVAGG